MFSAPTTEREWVREASGPKGRKRVGEGKIPPSLCVDEVPTNDTSVRILLFPSTVYLSLIPTKPPSRDPINSGRERKRRGEDWRKATCGTLQIYNYKHTQKWERALGIPIILYTLGPHNTTHNQRGHNSRIDIDVRDGLFANGRIVTFCVFCVWNKF